MSKLPNITFPKGVESVTVTPLPGGQPVTYKLGRKDDYLELEVEDPVIRRALLQRGGVEMIEMTWWVRRDIDGELSIGQWDGSIHHHKPTRGGVLGLPCNGCTELRVLETGIVIGEHDESCDHTVTCNSPACQQFFWDEWRRGPGRPLIPRLKHTGIAPEDEYLPVAAPSRNQRPATAAEFEARINQTLAERTALGQAAEIGRKIADAMRPDLYQATASKK